MVNRKLFPLTRSSLADSALTTLVLVDFPVLFTGKAIQLHNVLRVVVVPALLLIQLVVRVAPRPRILRYTISRDTLRDTIFAPLLLLLFPSQSGQRLLPVLARASLRLRGRRRSLCFRCSRQQHRQPTPGL